MKAVRRIYQARELLWNLTLRELRTKYRDSVLGWAWSMANPLATIAIYTFVFNVIFKTSVPVGQNSGLENFALFLITAYLPWNFFSAASNIGMGAITANAGLVRRVPFPREVLALSGVLHASIQFLIELALLSVILLLVGSPILPWLPVVVVITVVLAVYVAGFALALGAISVLFRDTVHLWPIAVQIGFFLTPIVYSRQMAEEQLPRWFQVILELNPMNAFVTTYRDLLYHARGPELINVLIMVGFAAVSFVLGWKIFLRLARRLPEEV
jgi:ABC-type polysaccharide/polyol phosphate export permease